MKIFYLFFPIFCLLMQRSHAQNEPNNTAIKGLIVDKDSRQEIAGAVVELLNFVPRKLVTSDNAGGFELNGVPLGRHKILVRKDGYENGVISDIILNAGGDLNLEVELMIAANQNKGTDEPQKIDPDKDSRRNTVFKSDKDLTNNPFSAIAAQPFTVEEVIRYAGSRFDLSRLTNNLAGVTNNYDARNDIVVRGNSPAFLSWQLEELQFDNLNHFGVMGTTGGTTPIINIFALGKADFLKGSFSAQYSNCGAGIFDLSLRKGNNKKRQILALIGSQRAEFVIEAPFLPARGGSYLLSVRSSVGSYIYNNITYNIDPRQFRSQQIRDWADPEHHDFNLKIDLGKMNKQEMELFALGGFTRYNLPFNRGALRDKIRFQIFEFEDFYYDTRTAIGGFKHSYRPSGKLLIRNVLGYSFQQQNGLYTANIPDTAVMGRIVDRYTSYKANTTRNNIQLHSYIQNKISNQFSLKAGFHGNFYNLQTLQNYIMFNLYDANYIGNFVLGRAYVDSRWNINKNLSLFAGFATQYLSLTKQLVAEPRASLVWQINPRHSFSAGGGMFNQMQQMQSMVYTPIIGYDSLDNPIYDRFGIGAKMMHRRQADIEYKWLISQNWRLKVQAYYQQTSNTLVSQDSSYFCGLNTGISFFDNYYGTFRNGGAGKNMGVEASLEKFFHRGIYLLLTGSVFDAKNKGSDGIWRNSAFNNRYIANFLIGKEWNFGKFAQHVFFADLRFSTHGGRPYTPIDVEATYQQGLQNLGLDEILIDSLYNGKYAPDFYQIDLKLGVRLNDLRRHISHNIRVDFFNAFNIRNVYTYRYSEVFNPFGQPERGFAQPIYQRGFIPDLSYYIQF